jgi:hypothetical protein
MMMAILSITGNFGRKSLATETLFQITSDRRFKEYIPDNPFTGFGFFLSWNETDV